MQPHLLNLLLIFLLILPSNLFSQTPPPCDVPYINLTGYNFSGNITLQFVTLPDEATSVEIQHRFFQNEGDTLVDNYTFMNPPEFVELPFDPFTLWNEFTSSSICENGESHLGSSFIIDARGQDASAECPAPSGLVINSLDSDNINFSWNVDDFAQLYHITYSPVGGVIQDFDSPSPSHDQALDDVSLHWFEIYNICDTNLLAPLFLRSPSIKFLIVSVDDVKILVCNEGLDSIRSQKPLQIRCSAHDNFETNKDRFFNFHDSLCLMDPVFESDLNHQISIHPNPFKNQFQVSVPQSRMKAINLRLLDLNGKIINLPESSLSFSSRTIEISLLKNELSAGVYFLECKTPLGKMTKKIIKMP